MAEPEKHLSEHLSIRTAQRFGPAVIGALLALGALSLVISITAAGYFGYQNHQLGLQNHQLNMIRAEQAVATAHADADLVAFAAWDAETQAVTCRNQQKIAAALHISVEPCPPFPKLPYPIKGIP